MGRIAQDICLRWSGPNPFGPIRPPDLRPKGGEVGYYTPTVCANYWQRFGVMQTVRDKATGVQLAWIEDGKVFDAKTRAMVGISQRKSLQAQWSVCLPRRESTRDRRDARCVQEVP